MWIRLKGSKEEFVGQCIFLQNLQMQPNTLICDSLQRWTLEGIGLQDLHDHHHSKGKNSQAESI